MCSSWLFLFPPSALAAAAAPLEAAAAAAAALAPAAVGLFGGMVFRERRSGACCFFSFFCAALVPLRARGRATTDREDAEQAVGGRSMRRDEALVARGRRERGTLI